jgi:hypothetical protein
LTIQQAPRGKVAQRLLSAATGLVLCAWMFPSLAATGTDSRSDQPLDAPPMSLPADRKLPMPAIDHAAASGVTPDTPPRDDSAAEAASDTARAPTGPRVDIMLRRIFDEAQARQPRLQPPRENDDFTAPLAVDKSETLEDPPDLLEADPADAAAELPGFGADELLRYRQQMYRTDI